MLLIQFTGLSGAGKTTLSKTVQALLEAQKISTVIIDGDEYRRSVCSDLGFSKADRIENIRRLASVAQSFSTDKAIAIIAAINPFEEVRNEIAAKYDAKTVWVKCGISTLIKRDPKGLYKKALLPDGHPEKIADLTGINDIYEPPLLADLIIDTEKESEEESVKKLYHFIKETLNV